MTEAEQINRLKTEKNAVIMAHYYVRPEVQDIADYVGDSYFLSEKAAESDADIIVLCGVSFMGESAKIINTEKKVLLPEPEADCPMAHMASREQIEKIRREYSDLAVVCYVNSTAELKAASDVCVTSSNALKYRKSAAAEKHFLHPGSESGPFHRRTAAGKEFYLPSGVLPCSS